MTRFRDTSIANRHHTPTQGKRTHTNTGANKPPPLPHTTSTRKTRHTHSREHTHTNTRDTHTQLSRVRSFAQSLLGLHGPHSPFSLKQHSDYAVWHKKFKAAAWLAFEAVAVVSREVATVACPVCRDIASLASSKAELAEAVARKESRVLWKMWTAKAAEGGAKLALLWTTETV